MMRNILQREITILAARYWPQMHGGVEQHMWQLSCELAKADVQVQVLTENRTAAPQWEQVMPNLAVERRGPIDHGRLWRWRPLVNLQWWTRWLRSARLVGPIWASCPMLATASILAGHAKRTIFNPAGCVAAMRQIGRLYPHVTTMQLPRSVAWMDRFAYRRSGRVVLSSTNLARQFARVLGQRNGVQVMPLAATPPEVMPDRAAARKQWGLEPGAFVIGCVGRLDPCKGLDFLFDAVSQMAPGPNMRLLIVGEGSDKARLQQRARHAGLERHIVWVGRLADPACAYAAMDVLALPSIYEAFGLVLLEAMAGGVAVIGRRGNGSTILTACDEIIEEGRTGYLCDSHDPSHLAECLRQLEAQPQLCRAMGLAGRSASWDQTWQRYARHCLVRQR